MEILKQHIYYHPPRGVQRRAGFAEGGADFGLGTVFGELADCRRRRPWQCPAGFEQFLKANVQDRPHTMLPIDRDPTVAISYHWLRLLSTYMTIIIKIIIDRPHVVRAGGG